MTTPVPSATPTAHAAGQLRLVFHEVHGTWRPVVTGYFVYATFFVAGFFLSIPAFNVAGALVMVSLSTLGNYRAVPSLRWSAASTWALLFAVALGVTQLAQPASVPQTTLKYALAALMFVLAHGCRVGPMNRSCVRVWLLTICFALLGFSLFAGNYYVQDGEKRMAGIFVNPNNLALMAPTLLLFINEQDSRRWKLGVHSVVVSLLVVTATSGAILAYVAALTYAVRRRLTNPLWLAAAIIVAIGVVVVDGHRPVLNERMQRQYRAAADNLHLVFDRRDIAYGTLAEEYGGGGSLSGLWRLLTWRHALDAYADGGPSVWLWGTGVGTSLDHLGALPHNDYVRLLLETGALGLLTFGGFLAAAWRGLPGADRHVLAFFAVYCLTENNIDNFLVFSLVMVFLGSCSQTKKGRAAPRGRNVDHTQASLR